MSRTGQAIAAIKTQLLQSDERPVVVESEAGPQEIDPVTLRRLAYWAAAKYSTYLDEDRLQSIWLFVLTEASHHRSREYPFSTNLGTHVLHGLVASLRQEFGWKGGKQVLRRASSLDVRISPSGEDSAPLHELFPARNGDPVRPAIAREQLAAIRAEAQDGDNEVIAQLIEHARDPVEASYLLGQNRNYCTKRLRRLRERLGVRGYPPHWPRSNWGTRGSRRKRGRGRYTEPPR